jgi:hypothetical protein
MAWEVEYTGEFGEWWERLTEQEQGDVAAYVGELERRGPMLPSPLFKRRQRIETRRDARATGPERW